MRRNLTPSAWGARCGGEAVGDGKRAFSGAGTSDGVGGLLEEVECEVDVFAVHLQHDRLRVRVANVEMAVMEDENFVDGFHSFS